MKKIFYILASAIVALGAVACQNEVDENINPNDTKEITFNVSFDESTRIAGTVADGKATFTFDGKGINGNGESVADSLYVGYSNFDGESYDTKRAALTNTDTDPLTFTADQENMNILNELVGVDNVYAVNRNNEAVDSELGASGLLFRSEIFEVVAGENNITLSLACPAPYFTVPAETTVTLTAGSFEKEFTEGNHWVAISPNIFNKTIAISYSIGGVTVKQTTLTDMTNKVYNLGTLNAAFTVQSIANLIAEAEAGSTITLPAGATITGSEILTIDKNITIDGNGATLSSTAGRAINVSGEGVEVAISNLNIECTGERGVNVIQNAKSVTLTDVNITAANYAVNVASSAAGAVVVINGGEYNGLSTVNVAADNANVTITGATINCNDENDGENYGAIAIYPGVKNATITATNCDFNISGDSHIATNSGTDCSITLSPEGEVTENVAAINYGDYAYVFSTLEEALEYAKEGGETVILLRDAEIAQEGTFKIDLNGNQLYVAEGYTASENGGVWTVVVSVAKVEGIDYGNLADALTAAGTTKVITLLADATNVATACVINANGHALTTGDGFLALKNYNNANGYFDVVAVTKATDCAIPGTHNNWDTTANGVYIINGTSLRVAPNVAMDANNEFKFYLLNWDRAKGATTENAITVNSKLTAGGTNIKVGTKGTYDLYLNGNVAFYVANQDTNNKNILSTLGASTGDLFLNFNGQDWAASNATIAAYYYGGPSEATFVKMTDTNSDGIYECTAPADDYTHIIFVRLSEDTLNWDKKWNQTPGDSKVALKGAGSLGILTAYEQVEIVY